MYLHATMRCGVTDLLSLLRVDGKSLLEDTYLPYHSKVPDRSSIRDPSLSRSHAAFIYQVRYQEIPKSISVWVRVRDFTQR